jgi:hypothetical protein
MVQVGDFLRLKLLYGGHTSSVPPVLGDSYEVVKILGSDIYVQCLFTGHTTYFRDYELSLYFEPLPKPKHMLSLDEMAKLLTPAKTPAKCTCGAAAVKHPGHSSWCDIDKEAS